MDFKEAMSAVRAGTATEDQYAAIEKHYNDASSAVTGHRTRADNYAPIVEKHSATERILYEFGIDPKVDLSEQLKKFKSAPASQNDEMTRTVNELRGKLEIIENEKKKADSDLAIETAKSYFSKTFNDSHFISGDVHLEGLMAMGKIGVDKDRKPFVKVGDEFLPADDAGIEKFIKSIPSLEAARKSKQKAGGGTHNGGDGNTGEKTMSRSSFDALGYKERADKINDGYKII